MRTSTLLLSLLVAAAPLATACGDDEMSSGAGGGGTASGATASSTAATSTGAGGDGGGGGTSTSTITGSGGGGGGGGDEGATATIDCATDVIVHYQFQNQVVGSQLDLQRDGTFDVAERTCCPPTEELIEHPPLDAASLAELLAWIEDAAATPTRLEEGGPTAEGSPSGTLQACTAAGEGIVLRDVARNDQQGGLDVVTVNRSEAAAQIRQLVEAIVEQDMN